MLVILIVVLVVVAAKVIVVAVVVISMLFMYDSLAERHLPNIATHMYASRSDNISQSRYICMRVSPN